MDRKESLIWKLNKCQEEIDKNVEFLMKHNEMLKSLYQELEKNRFNPWRISDYFNCIDMYFKRKSIKEFIAIQLERVDRYNRFVINYQSAHENIRKQIIQEGFNLENVNQ